MAAVRSLLSRLALFAVVLTGPTVPGRRGASTNSGCGRSKLGLSYTST